MLISSSGQVGIGRTPFTNVAGYALQIRGTSFQTFLHFSTATHGDTHDDGMIVGADNNAAYIVQRENSPLTIHTNNTEQMRIDSSGNVGIGQTSMPHKLCVNGNIQLGSASQLRSSSSSGQLQIQGGSTFPGGNILLGGGNADDNIVFSTTGASTSSTERMRITSSGTVNIGNSSTPASANVHLDLYCNSSYDAFIRFRDQSGAQGLIGFDHGSNAMQFYTNGSTEAMRIDSSGRLLVGQTTTSNNGLLCVKVPLLALLQVVQLRYKKEQVCQVQINILAL